MGETPEEPREDHEHEGDAIVGSCHRCFMTPLPSSQKREGLSNQTLGQSWTDDWEEACEAYANQQPLRRGRYPLQIEEEKTCNDGRRNADEQFPNERFEDGVAPIFSSNIGPSCNETHLSGHVFCDVGRPPNAKAESEWHICTAAQHQVLPYDGAQDQHAKYG